MEAIAAAARQRLHEFTAFDLSILVWAFDVLNLGDLPHDLLPAAMDHFARGIQDEDEFGMFWFDFANVVSARVSSDQRRDFDRVFEGKLLRPVTDHLTELTAGEVAQEEA